MAPDVQNLVRAARLAAVKLKREYDRQMLEQDGYEPPFEEGWAEMERLNEALEGFDHIYPLFVEECFLGDL